MSECLLLSLPPDLRHSRYNSPPPTVLFVCPRKRALKVAAEMWTEATSQEDALAIARSEPGSDVDAVAWTLVNVREWKRRLERVARRVRPADDLAVVVPLAVVNLISVLRSAIRALTTSEEER